MTKHHTHSQSHVGRTGGLTRKTQTSKLCLSRKTQTSKLCPSRKTLSVPQRPSLPDRPSMDKTRRGSPHSTLTASTHTVYLNKRDIPRVSRPYASTREFTQSLGHPSQPVMSVGPGPSVHVEQRHVPDAHPALTHNLLHTGRVLSPPASFESLS